MMKSTASRMAVSLAILAAAFGIAAAAPRTIKSLPYYLSTTTVGERNVYKSRAVRPLGQVLLNYTPKKTGAVDIAVGPGDPITPFVSGNVLDTFAMVVDKASGKIIASDDSTGTDLWDNPYIRITLKAGKAYVIVAQGNEMMGRIRVAVTNPSSYKKPTGMLTTLPQAIINTNRGAAPMRVYTQNNAPAAVYTIQLAKATTVDIYAGNVDAYPDSLQDVRLTLVDKKTNKVLKRDNSCGIQGLGSTYIRFALKAGNPYYIIVSGVDNRPLGNGFQPPPSQGRFALWVRKSTGNKPGPYCFNA